jgi:protein TonB
VNAQALPDTFTRQLPPVNDRMLTTWFLAALVHAIIILGVSFSLPDRGPSKDAAPSIEVVLTSEQTPRLKSNPHAQYLGQRSQRGSGNTRSRERASVPRSSRTRAERLGALDGSGDAAQMPGANGGATRLLASVGPSAQILYFARPKQPNQPAQIPELLQDRPDLGVAPTQDDEALRLRGESHGELWITADTRESDVAVYLDGWRRKVEHVGTLNFPNAARRQGLSGTPIVEVAIAASGKLISASIRRTSGHSELDQAALDILRLASPFDPFPKALGAAHDSIRFAYEWQFLKGESQGASVSPVEDTPVKTPP